MGIVLVLIYYLIKVKGHRLKIPKKKKISLPKLYR
jgi:hypothetical protein